VNTADLPAEEAQRVEAALSALRSRPGTGASQTVGTSRPTYHLTVTEGQERYEFDLTEPEIPPELRPLIQALLHRGQGQRPEGRSP
jgi:Emfourin